MDPRILIVLIFVAMYLAMAALLEVCCGRAVFRRESELIARAEERIGLLEKVVLPKAKYVDISTNQA